MLFVVALLILLLGVFAEEGERIQYISKTAVTMRWKADYATQSILVSVSLSNSNLDWVGIGFSDHGSFNHSDLCVFRKGQLRDYFIDDNFMLQVDRAQDCELTRMGPKKFEFRRKFMTCDPSDYAITTGTTQFIIAGGYEFTRNFASSTVEKYLRFGQVIEAPVPIPRQEKDTRELTILADAALIPAEETTYWCVVKKMPVDILKKKHHVIKMHAVVQPGHEHIVHHMQIFLCQTDDQEEYNGNCNSEAKPNQAKSCSHVIAAWAMGEGPVYYPEEAGFPLGGAKAHQYIMVEIHYNNVFKEVGKIDNSGFQFVATPQLRQFDAGIMELGLIYSDANSIPPGQNAFPITAHCVSDCTDKLPGGGIYVFASQLHAHLTGRKLWTSHYRDGVKIGEINSDMHYIPQWQHVQQVRPYVHVKRGDVLSTTCVYETRNRDKVSLGGYGIEDEMCVNYVYYYPASQIEVCKSAISNSTLHAYFKHRYGLASNLPIHKKYNSIEWNQEEARALHELYSAAPINMHCLRNDGSLFPGKEWSAMPQPHPVSGPFVKARDQYECPALNDF